MAVDGARLAILRNRIEGVTRKMANTLYRTGRSGVVNRVKDFSCCIVTAACDLVATGESLPIHVLSGPDLMARAMLDFHPGLRRGDAFLHNSPYHGCGHAADHTILVPVFDDHDRHRFTVLAKAHQADVGNSVPSTYVAAAHDVYEEGALIFPAVQIQRDYQTIEDIVRMCRAQIRVPDQWYGDFLAMVGAARIGEQELTALAADVGWDALDEHCAAWLDYSERRCIEAIRALPRGTVEASSIHGPFPGLPPDGISIKAIVSVDPDDGYVDVDLTDNPDCTPNGMNLSHSTALTAAYIGIINSIDHSMPKNAGSMRRFRIKLRENCICGIPRHPTSCSLGTSNITERVSNAIQMALAGLSDRLGMAEVGSGAPACGVVSGTNPTSGEPFIDSITLGFTAGPGNPRTDAWLTLGALGGGGVAHQDSVELTELYQPMEVTARYLLPDTEGAGRFRGASSLRVEFGPAAGSFVFSYMCDGLAAKGVRGGLPGGPPSIVKRTRDGVDQKLPPSGQVVVAEGERLITVSSGGGGYGSPASRSREQVRRDVLEKWITPERARAVYGLDAVDQADA